MAKPAQIQGWWGHGLSGASPQSPPTPMSSTCRAHIPCLTSTEPGQWGSDCYGGVPQTKAKM